MYDILSLIRQNVKKVFRDCEADFAKQKDVYTKEEVDEILENALQEVREAIDEEIDNSYSDTENQGN